MKAKLNMKTKKEFVPFSITLTAENIQDARELYEISLKIKTPYFIYDFVPIIRKHIESMGFSVNEQEEKK
jgi:hypothetical protein